LIRGRAGIIFSNRRAPHYSDGGTITNQAGGDINGPTGILVSGGNATVVDAGTIFGTSYAVQFTGGGTDRLVLDPDAVVSGTVSGAGAHSTLELAAGNSTITGLGSQFLGLGQVVVDHGANWTLTNANSLAAGSTLGVSGTLTVSGSMVDNGKATISGTLRTSGTGAIRIGQGATMSAGSVLAPGSTVRPRRWTQEYPVYSSTGKAQYSLGGVHDSGPENRRQIATSGTNSRHSVVSRFRFYNESRLLPGVRRAIAL
jgi:hypothetical protein